MAKRLTGLVLSEPTDVASGFVAGSELLSADGKNAGKITSVTFSRKLEKSIAMAFVRYDYLADGTELLIDGSTASVHDLPLVS